METYKIIIDEDRLRQFIEWLPDTTESTQLYCSLFARKKYCPDMKWIKSDKSQLARFTSAKNRLFNKIRQKECPLGAYRQFQDEMPIPNEALALYVNPNPRCLYKATLHGIRTLATLIELNNKNHNPHQEMLSCIQSSSAKKIWTDFDIDTDNDAVLEDVEKALGGDKACRKILKSRGGYHVLVKLDAIPDNVQKTWYKAMAALADVKGDTLMPVPGCIQGYLNGQPFSPYFID
jgi:hypothetical protein